MFKFTLCSLLVWGLAIQTSWAQGGQSCNQAVNAQQGINIADNSLGDQWFSYTATSTGKVTVSSCGQTTADTYVEVFDGCNVEAFTFSNDFCEKQSEVSFEVISGLSYQICWRAKYTNRNFEWFLTEAPIEQGEFCTSAITVEAGSSNTSIPTNQYRWYEFTASRTGKITIEAGPDCKVAVFDNCNYTTSLNNDDNWNPAKVAIEGVAGESYLVALFNSGSNSTVNWLITESDWQTGERCSDPIEVYNLNEAPIDHDSGTDKWYRFIAFEDGDVTISSVGLTNQDTYLEIYEGCGSERIAFSDDASGLQSELVLNAKANKAYYIKWDNIFQLEPYAWNLKSGNYSTSLPEMENASIGVYPNPSFGPVTIDLRGFESEMVNISVMSVTGAAVKMFRLPGGKEVSYDLSDLSKGIYQIVLEDLVSKKVVKFLKK
ncbi:Por secretion system C-terminal sorting domain-containing protein [Saccharicrinis carchari]|uniref:Por secretion system C-terminal sorting domain-containing protein n=1 Tax=Saccharicrinis carchari TaxID=1168039 RepID=A0A521C5M5_SACCC|nr:T9SS type A sorting domain-containing protein [Saccharicrinis carchari]SMO54131.1 Por secretion system C-terminal sorting domain-containing protein [Saccharicrinis carchari]